MNNRQSLSILIIMLILGVMINGVVSAQDGGRFCVRAYDDLNSNGLRDAGETLLSHSIGATLLDANGFIFASATLDTSELSSQGLICFENLPDGQYTVSVTSAEYLATGLDNMTAIVNADSLLVFFDYGGRMAGSTIAPVSAVTDDDEARKEEIIQLLVAGGGAVFTMLVTIFIGFIIYLLVLRRSNNQQPAYDSTGAPPPNQQYMRPTEPPPPYEDNYDQ
jgi:hypothetical protein